MKFSSKDASTSFRGQDDQRNVASSANLRLDVVASSTVADDGPSSTPPRRRHINVERLKSPSFDSGPFVRSFFDPAGAADQRDASPIPALRHVNVLHDRQQEQVSSATLGKMPKQKSLDVSAMPSLTNARLRGGVTSKSFRGYFGGGVQPPPPVEPPSTTTSSANVTRIGVGDDSSATNSNLPRRHKSFERPLEVRHAHITPTGQKHYRTVDSSTATPPSNGGGGSGTTGGDESPVWKSHDSGIKSCESGLR